MSEFDPQIHVFASAEAALLNYGFLPFPDPLQASRPAQLTLIVSNGTSQYITVTSIAITLPVGTTAKTLTASAAGIGTVRPDDWSAKQDGGIFTLTPTTPAAGQIGRQGLTFIFTGITVNDQPGTCTIAITEAASAPGKPAAVRTTGIAVQKFPETFTLSGLTVTPTAIGRGGSTVLLWTGSATTSSLPVRYTLQYDPDGNGQQTFAVGASGPYNAINLTAPVVVFTLTATVPVPGQDQPLIVQRQAIVTVSVATVSFSALPSTVAKNGITRLAWTTTGTTTRTLDPGATSLPPSGYAYVLIKGPTVFTLRATAPNQAPISSQQTITVVDTIVGTDTFSSTGPQGAPGYDGANGASGRPGGQGSSGRRGSDNAGLRVNLGPLDPSSTPARVARFVYHGGKGGTGGKGGSGTPGGIGGPGGPGGDTVSTLELVFHPSLQPQQVIVDITPGPGGDGGTGGANAGGGNASPGSPGNPGGNSATLRFTELSG
jgi:hypothetical protein